MHEKSMNAKIQPTLSFEFSNLDDEETAFLKQRFVAATPRIQSIGTNETLVSFEAKANCRAIIQSNIPTMHIQYTLAGRFRR
jgi:hypothetical protein